MEKSYFISFKKEFFFLMVLLASGFSAYAQFPAPYCTVTFTNAVEPITLVQIAGINNTTSETVTGAVALQDFTAMTGNVTAGVSYPITLKGNTDGMYTNYFRVYIDWNQNNVFTDAGESYDIGTIVGSTGVDAVILTGNIAVPLTALGGSTRMRVMKRFNAYPTGPCQTGAGFGQAEDYTLAVTGGADCTGAPTVSAATSTVTSACAAVPFTLSATVPSASGLSYQWQSSTDAGVTWTNLGTAQASASYTVANQTVATSYRLIVTCTPSSQSTTSAPVAVAQNIPTNCYCVNTFNFDCTDGDLMTNVTFGSINNTTACGNTTTGYTNYSATITPAAVVAGATVPISVTVGNGFSSESVGVWIDYNQNGVFEASEYTYVGTGSGSVLTSNVIIPATALDGITRMRVVVSATIGTSFNATFSCGPIVAENNYGEMEDYAVDIDGVLSTPAFNTSKFVMYPNPTTGIVYVKFDNQTDVNAINVYSVSGQLVFSKKITSSSDNYSIDLQQLSSGVYIVKIETDKGTQVNRLIKN